MDLYAERTIVCERVSSAKRICRRSFLYWRQRTRSHTQKRVIDADNLKWFRTILSAVQAHLAISPCHCPPSTRHRSLCVVGVSSPSWMGRAWRTSQIKEHNIYECQCDHTKVIEYSIRYNAHSSKYAPEKYWQLAHWSSDAAAAARHRPLCFWMTNLFDYNCRPNSFSTKMNEDERRRFRCSKKANGKNEDGKKREKYARYSCA